MLNCGGGGGGVGEVIGDGGEGGGGVGGGGVGEVTGDGGEGGGGSHGNPCFINLTALRREACATPLSSLKGGEISGLYSRPLLPSFL